MPEGGSITQNIWSIANQFGNGHAWLVRTKGSGDAFHLSFTSLSGQTVFETVASGHVKVVYGSGSFEFDKLPSGGMVARVYVTPSVCGSAPDSMIAAVGASASYEVDAHGIPTDYGQEAAFSSALKALACRTTAVATELRAFMAQTGLPQPFIGPEGAPLPTQKNALTHPLISPECGHAVMDLSIAAAGLASALALAGGTAGAGSPAVLIAWAGYVAASLEYEHACAGTI